MDPSTQISHWLREVCSASKTDIRFPTLGTAHWQRLSVVAIESTHSPGAPVHMCDYVCTHTHIHTTVQGTQGMWAENWKYLLQFIWTWLEGLDLKIRHLKPREVKYISQSHKPSKNSSKIHPFSSNHL